MGDEYAPALCLLSKYKARLFLIAKCQKAAAVPLQSKSNLLDALGEMPNRMSIDSKELFKRHVIKPDTMASKKNSNGLTLKDISNKCTKHK